MVRLAFALLVLVAAPAAFAQGTVQPPPGWGRSSDGRNLLLTSPTDGAGRRVLYMIRAVEPVAGSVEAWFGQLVSRIAGDGVVTQRSGIRREEAMLKESLVVRRADGAEVRIDAMAYGTPEGQQMMAVVFPRAIGASDARVTQAYDHFAGLRRSGFRLASSGSQANPPRAQPSPATPPRAAPGTPPRMAQPPSPGPGKNCRREPVWGQRISPFCQPSGVCSDRVIKEYRTVCS